MSDQTPPAQPTSMALATLKDRHAYVANSLAKSQKRMQQLIPVGSGLMPARAIAVVLDCLYRNPDLLSCKPASIVRSVMHAAEVGLELGSPLGEAYLVPFKGEATMMIGYKGFVRLMLGSPRVHMIKGVLVRDGDTFEVDEGNNHLTHVWAKENRGKVTHAYARVWYSESMSQFEVMDRKELDQIKSMAKGRSPWFDSKAEPEMMKKCPIRRIAKVMDLSALGRRAVELDNLQSLARGEVGGLVREGFTSERIESLRDVLKVQTEKVEPIDAEFEE